MQLLILVSSRESVVDMQQTISLLLEDIITCLYMYNYVDNKLTPQMQLCTVYVHCGVLVVGIFYFLLHTVVSIGTKCISAVFVVEFSSIAQYLRRVFLITFCSLLLVALTNHLLRVLCATLRWLLCVKINSC